MGSPLAFDLDPAENFSHEDFIRGASNATAFDLVEQLARLAGAAVAMVGPEGAGKSHLAAIWATAARARPPRERGDRQMPPCRQRSQPARS